MESPLGKPTRYPDAYDASLLCAVPRAPQREALGLGGALPFSGEDRWTVWEAAWLDARRRPRAGIATFAVPCTSPSIVESKSVKLYFASLNHAMFDSEADATSVVARDLSSATGLGIDVRIDPPLAWPRHAREALDGDAIDDVEPSSLPDGPDAGALRCGGGMRRETLVWHGFRAVCPVTGQPDYASVRIGYDGAPIERASLAAYLGGFRRHPAFHEHCVERMFVDIARACAPRVLCIEAYFTRRGGIDIVPARWTTGTPGPAWRASLRQ
jgi:7-cyano-7-deazaguanine reductase